MPRYKALSCKVFAVESISIKTKQPCCPQVQGHDSDSEAVPNKAEMSDCFIEGPPLSERCLSEGT
jgi:hypothetical protein